MFLRSDVVFEQAAASSMFYSCVDGGGIIHPQLVLLFSVFVFGKWKSCQITRVVNERQKGNLAEDIFETSFFTLVLASSRLKKV